MVFVAAPVPLLSMTARARFSADGPVRTTVPVSLRGTALRLASAAVCGVTPTAAGGVAGAVVPVWAAAFVAVSAKTALKKIILFCEFISIPLLVSVSQNQGRWASGSNDLLTG